MSLITTLRENSVPFEVNALEIYQAETNREMSGEELPSGTANRVLNTTRNSSEQFVAMGGVAYEAVNAEHPDLDGRVLANGDAFGQGTGEMDMKKDEAEKEAPERDPYENSETVRNVFIGLAAGMGGGR